MLFRSDGIVDWSRPAAAIERMRRALEPWPRTTTFLRRDGAAKRLVLDDAQLAADPAPAGTPPGTVVAADDRGIAVACGDGAVLLITRVVPEGKRAMAAGEFIRGNAIHAGTRLG